jgi:RNA recognition motif-containing protein
VKKIFIGQLPTDFVEQDLSNYFSQFGLIDTIELVNEEIFYFVFKFFYLAG